jgi:hypothetical protein
MSQQEKVRDFLLASVLSTVFSLSLGTV